MDFLSRPLFPELFQRVSVTHSLSGFSRLLNPVQNGSFINYDSPSTSSSAPSLRPFTHKSGSNRTTITRVLYRKRGMASTILSSFKSLRGRVEKNGSFEQGYSMINSSLNPCSTKSFCILPPYQKTLGRGHKYFIDFSCYSWSKT